MKTDNICDRCKKEMNTSIAEMHAIRYGQNFYACEHCGMLYSIYRPEFVVYKPLGNWEDKTEKHTFLNGFIPILKCRCVDDPNICFGTEEDFFEKKQPLKNLLNILKKIKNGVYIANMYNRRAVETIACFGIEEGNCGYDV